MLSKTTESGIQYLIKVLNVKSLILKLLTIFKNIIPAKAPSGVNNAPILLEIMQL